MALAAQPVSREAFKRIIDFIQSIAHGTVTLIVQDGRVLQLERNDKIRLDQLPKLLDSAEPFKLDQPQLERLYQRLNQELAGVLFGQVILHVKARTLVQIERVIKQRLTDLEGIYGDGI